MAGLLGAVETERDERLLESHRAGDQAAFGRLYELHYDRLLRFVRQRVRDYHLAEEITQDSFVRAYSAAAHLKDGSRFYPWLTVIAQRLAIDNFRRGGRVSPVAQFDRELGFEPPADEHLIAACEAEALEAALGRVRERHRQVLRWQTEGLTYEDIAQRLNAPLTTVPPLLFRARQALKREYLAVTEAERIAAVPLLGAFIAASRRVRARCMQFVSGLPDLHGLAVPAAGVVMGMGLLITPDAGNVDLLTAPPAAAAGQQDLGAQETAGETLSSGQVGDETSNGLRPEMSPPPPNSVVGGVEISLDKRRRDWGREQARDMPIYYEVGDVWFSADPEVMQRDVGRTLTGDMGWMEGE